MLMLTQAYTHQGFAYTRSLLPLPRVRTLDFKWANKLLSSGTLLPSSGCKWSLPPVDGEVIPWNRQDPSHFGTTAPSPAPRYGQLLIGTAATPNPPPGRPCGGAALPASFRRRLRTAVLLKSFARLLGLTGWARKPCLTRQFTNFDNSGKTKHWDFASTVPLRLHQAQWIDSRAKMRGNCGM